MRDIITFFCCTEKHSTYSRNSFKTEYLAEKAGLSIWYSGSAYGLEDVKYNG